MSTKILVVDHRDSSLNHLGDLLKANGFQVRLLSSGREALHSAKAAAPDLCIIDPMISGIDGFTLSQRLRKIYPRMPIVISTAIYKGDKYQRDAKTKYGASAYLEKPYSDGDLLKTIGSLLAPSPFQSGILDLGALPALPETGARQAPFAAEDLPADPVFDNWSDLPQDLADDPEMPSQPKLAGLDLDPSFLAADPLSPPPLTQPVFDEENRLTSEDIFGSVIEEVEGGLGPGTAQVTPFRSGPPPAVNASFAAESMENSDSYLEKTIDHALGDQPDPVPSPAVALPENAPGMVLRGENPASMPYHLLQLVGRDELFESWRAERLGDSGPQRLVTIRRVTDMAGTDDFIPLFVYEARALSNLVHPNLEHILEVAKSEDNYYLVTECLTGCTLQTLLNQCRTLELALPPSLGCHLGIILCQALHYAHKKKDANGTPLKVVHRALAPRYVMISPEGDIKLTHFDLTGKAATANEPPDTLRYRAPEQLAGSPGDARSDIFSLGALLFEGLAGRPLYAGTDSAAIMANRLGLTADLSRINPAVPEQLAAIIEKAIAPEPKNRHADMQAFCNELIQWWAAQGARASTADLAAFVNAVALRDKVALAQFVAQPAVVPVLPVTVAPPHEPPPRRRRQTVAPATAPVAAPRRGSGLRFLAAALAVGALMALLAWAYFHFYGQPVTRLSSHSQPPIPQTQAPPEESEVAIPEETIPPPEDRTSAEQPPDSGPPQDADQPPVDGTMQAQEAQPATAENAPDQLTPDESEQELERVRQEYLKKKELLEKLKKKEQ